MLENLTQRLSRVMKTMRGEARMTEANIGDALREVEALEKSSLLDLKIHRGVSNR